MEDNKKKMHYQRETQFKTTLSQRAEKIKKKAEVVADRAAGYAFWTIITVSVLSAVVLNIIKPVKSHKSKGQFESQQ